MDQEKKNKKLDRWAWWVLAGIVAIGVFILADSLAFIEFFWH